MKVAIIGSGISGNVVAHHLAPSHDVTVFEANDYVGGHTHTHDIDWQGQHFAVDTGFIVFNERTYPNFIALLDELGVEKQKTQMSFSVKNSNSGLEYCGSSLSSLFAQRRNLVRPRFYKMVFDILRFNQRAKQAVSSEAGIKELSKLSLAEFLAKGNYSSMFIDQYIVPMGAAIWSTVADKVMSFPAEFFIRFFNHHGLLSVTNQPQWYVIQGGSKSYLDQLTKNFKDDIRLNSPVDSIERTGKQVIISSRGQKETFDTVFIATHSDQALGMLTDPTHSEAEILNAIQYQDNEAVLHVDSSVLPRNRRAWGAWNYHLTAGSSDKVVLSYNMNMLQSIEAPVEFCVTLNPDDQIAEEHILKRLRYAHPLYTPAVIEAQARRFEISGKNNTFYCGAYWGNGFHEDGVVSALAAVKLFKVTSHG